MTTCPDVLTLIDPAHAERDRVLAHVETCARCAERLDAAQARIEAIRLDAEGRATTTPFAAG